MIEINLLPQELCSKKSNNWKSMVPLALCLTVLSMGVGISVAGWWQISQYRQQIAQIEGNLGSASYLTKDFGRWEEEKKKLKLNEQWRDSLGKEKVPAKSFLQEVAATVPEDAWLTRISLQGQNIVLEGKGLSYQSLVNFLNNLKEREYFQGEPNLTNSQVAAELLAIPETPTTSLVIFTITGQLAGGKKQ